MQGASVADGTGHQTADGKPCEQGKDMAVGRLA